MKIAAALALASAVLHIDETHILPDALDKSVVLVLQFQPLSLWLPGLMR